MPALAASPNFAFRAARDAQLVQLGADIAYTGATSERMSMRKVREVLRLKYESGRSHVEIAA